MRYDFSLEVNYRAMPFSHIPVMQKMIAVVKIIQFTQIVFLYNRKRKLETVDCCCMCVKTWCSLPEQDDWYLLKWSEYWKACLFLPYIRLYPLLVLLSFLQPSSTLGPKVSHWCSEACECVLRLHVFWAGVRFLLEDYGLYLFGRESCQVSQAAKGWHVSACSCV